jgi:hypothetical protein
VIEQPPLKAHVIIEVSAVGDSPALAELIAQRPVWISIKDGLRAGKVGYRSGTEKPEDHL